MIAKVPSAFGCDLPRAALRRAGARAGDEHRPRLPGGGEARVILIHLPAPINDIGKLYQTRTCAVGGAGFPMRTPGFG
jgi:hypothetical protein